MKYDIYLFDLDGTLTRSEEGITASVAYALEKLGRPVPSYDILKKFIGPPLMDSFTGISGMDTAEAQRAVEFYRERYTTAGWKENSVYPGIPHMLRSLKKHGAYIALASSKPAPSCKKILEYFALLPLFDAVSAPDPDNSGISKAELVRAALPDGCDHSRACMVGDRSYDMKGAKANGIAAVGALYGYGSADELSAAGADEMFEDIHAMTADFLEGDQPARGIFFSLEGSDGCGKTTQLGLLKDYLVRTGNEPVISREPGGTPIAEKIRNIILDVENTGMSAACEALLYAASRAEHVDKLLLPAVESGRFVLSDRYVDSSIAYQGCARELSYDFISQINSRATARLMPDATIFLDMDPETALERRRAATPEDRLELEKTDFFRKVYSGYDMLRKADPERIYTVNAADTPGNVHESVQAAVREALGRIYKRLGYGE